LEKNVSPRTRAIIPVHLYGQSADLVPIYEIAQRYGLIVIEDAAQAHGTKYHHKKIGSIALLTAFSFYPSKNLGCFGDGGCVTTNDPALASKLRMLRNYGQRQRYYHSVYGINSRLDEIQAAVLSAKLPHLDAWNERRRQIATLYDRLIQNPYVAKPLEMHYGFHVWHLYVLRVRGRSQFQDYLKTRGIGTMIHYPVPIHLQDAYKYLGYAKGAFPITERVSEEIVSIPIYPELTDAEVKYISDAINSFQPQA
jgi:dTDP-4-amino-4,6-dideoxygalactose transaminase